MPGIFDYLNNLSYDKNDMPLNDEFDSTYVPFLANRYFSYFIDTIMMANEVNLRSSLTKSQQYQYYFYRVRPQKRFTKWHKPSAIADILMIQEYYQVNRKRAVELQRLIDNQGIEYLKAATEKGGPKGKAPSS